MRTMQAASVALVATAYTLVAGATVPDLIPVQGVLTDDLGAPLDGPQNITFTLWDQETDGTALWTETYNGANQVQVDEGFFTVYLGSVNTLDFAALTAHDELWLGMSIGGDPEMSRARFASVPYALEAQVCERVGSLSETDITNGFSASDHDHAGDYAALGHEHDDRYYTEGEVDGALAGKADAAHGHDDTYFTETEVTALLLGKADAVHGHDDLYYTEGEVDTLLADKADAVHEHDADYVNVDGDTMTGELILNAGLSCTDCVDEGDLADGSVTEPKLGFDIATQLELDERRLHEVSGGVVTNEYDVLWSDTAQTALPDIGSVPISLAVTDAGAILSAGVQLVLRHAWLDTVEVALTFTPFDVAVSPVTIQLKDADPAATCDYTDLLCGATTVCDPVTPPCVEQAYDWPGTDAVVSGTLDDLVGLDPSGTWEITVTDTCETWPATCTAGTQFVQEAHVGYRIFADDRATVAGSLMIDQHLSVSGDLSAATVASQGDVSADGNLYVLGTSVLAGVSATSGDFSGYLDVNGNVILGGSSSDSITFNGAAASGLDMNGNLITNIGAAGTDFTDIGGLNLAGDLAVGTTSPQANTAVDVSTGGRMVLRGTNGGSSDANQYLIGEARRAQLVIASQYPEVVVASKVSNNQHGATLSFAAVNPSDDADYRKWVVNQGAWGSRTQFLEFGYGNAAGFANPHSAISDTYTVMTLDGGNRRVGILTRSPAAPLHVNGTIYGNGSIRNLAADGELGASADKVFRDTGDSWLRLQNGTGSTTYADLAVGTLYSGQAMYNPQGPAFCAYNSTGGDRSTTGTFVGNAEWFERGGDNHSTTTGRFTAPFAGVYQFSWSAYTNNVAGRTYFYSSNGTLMQTNGNGESMTVLAELALGQQVWLGGTATFPMTWYGTISHNLFCGHLVHRY